MWCGDGICMHMPSIWIHKHACLWILFIVFYFWDLLPVLMHINSPFFLPLLTYGSPSPLQYIVVILWTLLNVLIDLFMYNLSVFYLGYNYQLASCYYCILASCRILIKKKHLVYCHWVILVHSLCISSIFPSPYTLSSNLSHWLTWCNALFLFTLIRSYNSLAFRR